MENKKLFAEMNSLVDEVRWVCDTLYVLQCIPGMYSRSHIKFAPRIKLNPYTP